MISAQLEAMMTESGFAPDEANELVSLLTPLQGLCSPAPVSSGELLALFGEAPSEASYVGPRPQGRNRRAIAGALVLAISGVGATGLSAAANTLPGPWQHHVSDFSRHYLPFDFPEPPRLRQGAHLSGPVSTAAHQVRGSSKDRDVDGSGMLEAVVPLDAAQPRTVVASAPEHGSSHSERPHVAAPAQAAPAQAAPAQAAPAQAGSHTSAASAPTPSPDPTPAQPSGSGQARPGSGSVKQPSAEDETAKGSGDTRGGSQAGGSTATKAEIKSHWQRPKAAGRPNPGAHKGDEQGAQQGGAQSRPGAGDPEPAQDTPHDSSPGGDSGAPGGDAGSSGGVGSSGGDGSSDSGADSGVEPGRGPGRGVDPGGEASRVLPDGLPIDSALPVN